MYKIKLVHKGSTTEELIFDPTNQNKLVNDASLQLELGKAGTLTFTIPFDNDMRNNIDLLSDEIIVYRDDAEIFRGRPTTKQSDFDLNGTITCEGILAYLYDTFYQPYEFSGVPRDLLDAVIVNHNSLVDDRKKFLLGHITVKDKNDYIARSSTSYDRTLNIIADKLVNSVGGFLRVRVADGKRYLDWIDTTGNVASQNVELGVNILDIAKAVEYGDMITALLPLGAQDEETGEYLTIKDVNGGSLYIQDDALVADKGFICDCIVWEDVTIADNLLTKARDQLATMSVPLESITVDAIDLGFTDSAIEYINVGDLVRVQSAPHGINSQMELTSQKLDLLNPANDVLQFGATRAGLSSSSETARRVESQLTDNTVTLRKINATYADIEYLNTHYLTAEQIIADYIQVRNLSAEVAKINTLIAEDAFIKNIQAVALNADYIKSAVAEVGYLDATLANIDHANLAVAEIAKLFAEVGLISSAVITEGHITGFLDAVEVNANNITAGTLKADRLLLKDASGNYTGFTVDGETVKKLDIDADELIKDRTVTADHIVAGTITANEIASGTITSDKIVAHSITGEQIASHSITANEINTYNLEAQKVNVTDNDGNTIFNADGTTHTTKIGGFTVTKDNISYTGDFGSGTVKSMNIGHTGITTNSILGDIGGRLEIGGNNIKAYSAYGLQTLVTSSDGINIESKNGITGQVTGTTNLSLSEFNLNNKVKMWTDAEGGNLELMSPNGALGIQMDVYDNANCRLYLWGTDTGEWKYYNDIVITKGYGELYTGGNQILHTGNIGSQTVARTNRIDGQSAIPIGNIMASGYENNQINYIRTAGSSTPYTLNVNARWGNGTIATHNIVSSSSDIRLKDNIADTPVENALEVINQIKMREFDWKESGEHQKIGFIADELQEIDSKLAFGGEDEPDGSPNYKSVDTFYLIGYLTKAVQELSAEVESLKAEIETLKS